MLRLAYGGPLIAVEGDAAPLAWLREFLGATFDDAAPGAPPDRIVRLALGPIPPDAPGPTTETECFSLDGDFVRLPARAGPGGSLVLRDEPARIVYSVGRREVTIHAPADGAATRLGLLRVVREIATARALADGRVHLHAAAIDLSPGIVAIAGPRMSGKTTLLLHGLLAGAGRYVTNDRLLVDPGADPPLARGMPTIVTLRDETLARFPGFTARLRASSYARDRTLKEARAATGFRPNLTPAQLRVLASVEETGAGPLRAALFPGVAPDVERFELRDLGPEDATARLRRGLFLSTVPERPAAAFAGDAPPRDAPWLDRLCSDLATRVECIEVRLGARAYDGSGIWDAIRERLG